MINPIEMSHDLSYHKITLIFRETEIEKKYLQKLKKESLGSQKFAFIISFITYLLIAILLFIQKDEGLSFQLVAYALLTYSFGMFLMFLLTTTSNPLKRFRRIKTIVLNINYFNLCLF